MILTQPHLFDYIKKQHGHFLKSKKASIRILSIQHSNYAGPDILFFVKYGDDPLAWKSYTLSQCNFSCNCYTITKNGNAISVCEKCGVKFWNHLSLHSPCFWLINGENCKPFDISDLE